MKYLVYSFIIGTGLLYLTSCPGGDPPSPVSKPAPVPEKQTSPDSRPDRPAGETQPAPPSAQPNPTQTPEPVPTPNQGTTMNQSTTPGQDTAPNQRPKQPPGLGPITDNPQADVKPRPGPKTDYIELRNLADYPINHSTFEAFQKHKDEGLYWAIKRAMEKDESLQYPLAIVYWRLMASIMLPITVTYHYYVVPLSQLEPELKHAKKELKVNETYVRSDGEVYKIVRILNEEPKPDTKAIPFVCRSRKMEMDGIKGQAQCAIGRKAQTKKDFVKCFAASVMEVERLPNFKKEPRQGALDGIHPGIMMFSYDDMDQNRLSRRMFCEFNSYPLAGGHN